MARQRGEQNTTSNSARPRALREGRKKRRAAAPLPLVAAVAVMSVRARSGAQCIRTAGHQSQHQQLQHTSVPLFLILSSFPMRQTQSTAVEGEDGPLVDFPFPYLFA
ncbi:hypothetical protein B0H13DRAFT_2324532 [Mycena leptocephala]|nr:hypothetical protein B0H13DRAFT_2324532 [Mycena leptocephala]